MINEIPHQDSKINIIRVQIWRAASTKCSLCHELEVLYAVWVLPPLLPLVRVARRDADVADRRVEPHVKHLGYHATVYTSIKITGLGQVVAQPRRVNFGLTCSINPTQVNSLFCPTFSCPKRMMLVQEWIKNQWQCIKGFEHVTTDPTLYRDGLKSGPQVVWERGWKIELSWPQ